VLLHVLACLRELQPLLLHDLGDDGRPLGPPLAPPLAVTLVTAPGPSVAGGAGAAAAMTSAADTSSFFFLPRLAPAETPPAETPPAETPAPDAEPDAASEAGGGSFSLGRLAPAETPPALMPQPTWAPPMGRSTPLAHRIHRGGVSKRYRTCTDGLGYPTRGAYLGGGGGILTK
jgi:hypothetical protein